VVMHIGPLGNVRLHVQLTPLPSPIKPPEQYLILENTFEEWLELNGGGVTKISDHAFLIELGGAIAPDKLPLIELHSVLDLPSEDFASVLRELRTAGNAMGFRVEPEFAKSQAPVKLVVLAAYANYQAQSDQIVVRYMQLPAEIKSILIAAMEKLLSS